MPIPIGVLGYYVVMGGGAAIGGYMVGHAANNVIDKMNQDKSDPNGSTSSPGNESAAAGDGAKKQLAGKAGDCGTGNCDDPNNKKRKIVGYSAHALKRMQERGITPSAVQDAVDNPIRTTLQSNGNTEFVGRSATAVLSSNNWLVTLY